MTSNTSPLKPVVAAPATRTPATAESLTINRAGCWMSIATTLFIATLMAAIVFFLPPLNLYQRLFAPPMTSLVQAGDTLASSDGQFSISKADDESSFDAAVSMVSLRSFIDGDTALPADVMVARSQVPFYLAPQSAVYQVDTDQPTTGAATLQLARYDDSSIVDLYGYDAAQRAWYFIPSQIEASRVTATVDRIPQQVALFQPIPQQPIVATTYTLQEQLSDEVADLSTIVVPGGLLPDENGHITGSLAPGFSTTASYRVMPRLQNFDDPRLVDTTVVSAILSNAALRDSHAHEIAETVSASGYDGIFIDYRDLPDEQQAGFTAFLDELRRELDRYGLLLGVVVPMPDYDAATSDWTTGAYDWQGIGRNADYIQVNLPLNPTRFARGDADSVEAMLTWAVRQVDRFSLLTAQNTLSLRQTGDDFETIGYEEGLSSLGRVSIEAAMSDTNTIQPGSEIVASLSSQSSALVVDDRIAAPYITVDSSDSETADSETANSETADSETAAVASPAEASRIWLTTRNALTYRLDLQAPFALGGIALYDVTRAGVAGGITSALVAYKSDMPDITQTSNLALRWRIEGENGILSEVITDLGESIVVTLDVPDGQYRINAAVLGVDSGQSQIEDGARIALYQPTATPTQLPTATPSPTPTSTPTPAPVDNNAAVGFTGSGIQGTPSGGFADGSSFSAAAPPSGSIGGFEYGGQVTNAGSGRAIAAMQSAGMQWMKVQIRYAPGEGTGGAAGAISAAQGNGFKVMLSALGSPADLANGGEGYMQGFANWLGEIASFGPDAIEVWNEANIHREWPEGQISGTSYTRMLQMSYNAIKSRNGGTMVISAAPAPTGAEGAYPTRIMNDNRWLQQVVDAGGLQYMDCVGLHYNEGIVPPTATSGDPRADNYYTRYLTSQLNVYWGIIGGQRPICITELGYLTSAGYPPLPEFFSWASATTLQQHAAWLAQAIAVSAQSGKVRTLIVWNVDFTFYGGDPQGGYAIIRPDGSCPACSAIAGAR